jgi:glycosyltransferase involved in cell wall biosynthesis
MRIGFLLPANFSIGNPANGVRVQADRQARALRAIGHEVFFLSPMDNAQQLELDILQFFVGGFAHYGIEESIHSSAKKYVFAPIIDSNQSNIAYRFAAWIGKTIPKLESIPGVLKTQCEMADLVVCRSEHERQRIIRGLGIDGSKVKMVLNGVDIEPIEDVEFEPMTGFQSLPGKYVLHVSAYTQPRKNTIRMVRALLPTGLPIVLAGVAKESPTLEKLRKLEELHDNLFLFSYVSNEELEELYRNCKVFCLPSIHEGTGLVALEAGIRGANIVVTENGGPPDYFGPMAKYVDPTSEKSIRDAVTSAWKESENPALRTHLMNELSWSRSAEALSNAYKILLQLEETGNK